jgi:hypothetical protein
MILFGGKEKENLLNLYNCCTVSVIAESQRSLYTWGIVGGLGVWPLLHKLIEQWQHILAPAAEHTNHKEKNIVY